MGVYTFHIGKGVILTLPQIIAALADDLPLDRDLDDWNDDWDPLAYLIQEKFNGKYDTIRLGHDALRSRSGTLVPALDDYKHRDVIDAIAEWRAESEINDRMQLFFVGIAKELEGGEMEYYVSAPELMYSLPAYLPELVEYYPILKAKKVPDLEEFFDQKATIWTFTTDCFCCG